MRSSFFIVLTILFCLTQLSGCGIIKKNIYQPDGPPRIDIDPSKIRDAIPRSEPYHPYGTKDYVVRGKKYKVLKTSRGYVKTGYASWYGSKFHGRATSTQEKFNLYTMTAASPELPLPSYVEVINLRNGKKVIVRVNDRGPFHGGRILDLSYAAAKKLGYANEGIAPVKIIAIDPKTWKMNASINKDRKHASENLRGKLFLQLGAFSSMDNARALADRIKAVVGHSNEVFLVAQSNIHRVRIGPLVTMDEGKKLRELLESQGFDDIIFVK